MMDEFIICIEDVSKNYFLNTKSDKSSDFLALDNVSCRIAKGSRTGIIGPNGSGKSTLLKIIAGIIKPTAGTIKIYGKVASILELGAGFHPELSGRENIFLNGQIHGFSKKEINSKINEIIIFSELEEFIDEPVKNYSNGMYLRLAFSIIVNLEFDIYLFDEVLSVGDISFQQKCDTKLKELSKKGKTFVFVSHNLFELEKSDYYIHLDKGKLISKGHELNVLNEYLIKSTSQSTNFDYYEKSFEIVDFKEKNSFEDVELISFGINQETNQFFTNRPFDLTIKYRKKTNDCSINIFLVISDLYDRPIFCSSPIAGGVVDVLTNIVDVALECKIPENFLISQIYKVSLFFVKNVDLSFDSFWFSKKEIETKMIFSDIAAFKPNYLNDNPNFNFKEVDFKYSLFIDLNWEKTKIELP